MTSIIVEGWRFISHSFAIVNQFQCLEILKHPNIKLFHRDVAYLTNAWNPVQDIWDEATDLRLRQMPFPSANQIADANLRISYPYNFEPSLSKRTCVFGTAERGLVHDDKLIGGRSLETAHGDSDIIIVTPSHWSKNGFIRSGADPNRLVVIPIGVDTSIYKPLAASERDILRKRLGWEGFVFLHIGGMYPIKGINLLLKAFVVVVKAHPEARLFLKGSDSLYTSHNSLQQTMQELTDQEIEVVLPRLTYIGNTMSSVEIAQLYQAADAYVSPYLAEGFNIPVLEATACGLPVICTKGGSTDDFTHSDFTLHINSTVLEVPIDSEQTELLLNPNLDHLIYLMHEVIDQDSFREKVRYSAPKFVESGFTWKHVVDRLLNVLISEPNNTLDQSLTLDLPNLQSQAYNYFRNGEYEISASLYEQVILDRPDIKSNHWYLGLCLLLLGREEEAQMTWLFALEEVNLEEVDICTSELVSVLEEEVWRQEANSNYQIAWAIRQHVKEVNPIDINNLLQIIILSIKINIFTPEDISSLNIVESLKSDCVSSTNFNLLIQILEYLFDSYPNHSSSINLLAASLIHHPTKSFVHQLIIIALKLAHTRGLYKLSVEITEIILNVDRNNLEVLNHLISFYRLNSQFEQSIKTAQYCYSLLEKIEDKIYINHLVLQGFMGACGHWDEVSQAISLHRSLLESIFEKPPSVIDRVKSIQLFNSTFSLPFFTDDLDNVVSRSQLAALCQTNLRSYAGEKITKYKSRETQNHKPIKIGYLSHCLRNHSVGWLARWIFKYHDRERFSINTYFVLPKPQDLVQDWIANHSDMSYACEADGLKIAEQIYQDEVDILIDLDSITTDVTCEVMALKPAPIQATWLGWDASGIPSIDYYIGDRYVLPENAQAYYSEKIWRLPNAYIAVDGFEVGVPTLHRHHLNIPNDATIFLTAQKGYKRHPNTVRLQMKIIKSVPNSYLLIKGLADQQSIQNLFLEIAEQEGVSGDHLKFLPMADSESEHRANLGIADVILDTYPFNGATTTMETLWMCIPIVTRVGQQFAARNSYTMMMNAGIREGIAWTDEEYVEWGIRLGKDEDLRKQIFWKLKESRKVSPLWNAKQFTYDMEDAYQQMRNIYLEKKDLKSLFGKSSSFI